MKISSVCRSGRSCSCHTPCAAGITPGQHVYACGCAPPFPHMPRYVNTCEQLQCAENMDLFHICASARVPLGHHVQQVGQVRPACQCVEHLWHPCHLRASQLCPEAGRLGRGTSSQGGPQAVFVHYRFRDRTVPAGGRTFSPYLL